MSERELIEALKAGDEAAFATFFEKYRNTIYNFGLRFCGNPDDAAEVLQETLISTFKHIGKFKGESKLSTWLYRVASNACLMRRRKEKQAPVSLDELAESDATVHADDRLLPLDNLEQKELGSVIEKAMLDLPEQYRIPFILKEIERLPHQEIAEVLGTTVANAKVRVHRARLMLRERVAAYLQERPS